MCRFGLLAFLCGIMFSSAFASPSWLDKWHHVEPSHHDHHHHDHHEDGHECSPKLPVVPEEYRAPGGNRGCSCLLLVDETQVFRRDDLSGWYPCSEWGAYRCTQYCTELFQDEDLRYRSRQDSCDVIGREIDTPWYRRNQVCGSYGPYEDMPLQVDLCCRRGRPSNECTNDN